MIIVQKNILKIPKNKILSVQHKDKNVIVFYTKNLSSLEYVILKVECKGLHFLYGNDITLIEANTPVSSDKDEALFWNS